MKNYIGLYIIVYMMFKVKIVLFFL